MSEHDTVLAECSACHDLFDVDSDGLEYCEDCQANYCRECYREHQCENDEITGDVIVSEDGNG
jgi:hypothetical protein